MKEIITLLHTGSWYVIAIVTGEFISLIVLQSVWETYVVSTRLPTVCHRVPPATPLTRSRFVEKRGLTKEVILHFLGMTSDVWVIVQNVKDRHIRIRRVGSTRLELVLGLG